MKYYKLHIDTKDDPSLYHKISQLLSVVPDQYIKKDGGQSYDLWTYSAEEQEGDPYYDFINKFLDIIEPKYQQLLELGIEKSDINFWMIYEYDQQCGMEFHPQEMKRLGESGISLSIDCYQNK